VLDNIKKLTLNFIYIYFKILIYSNSSNYHFHHCVAIGAALFSVELLAVVTLVCPAAAAIVSSDDTSGCHNGDLVLLSLLRGGILVGGHNLLPVGRRLAELLHGSMP
jgi:hypothetical protein